MEIITNVPKTRYLWISELRLDSVGWKVSKFRQQNEGHLSSICSRLRLLMNLRDVDQHPLGLSVLLHEHLVRTLGRLHGPLGLRQGPVEARKATALATACSAAEFIAGLARACRSVANLQRDLFIRGQWQNSCLGNKWSMVRIRQLTLCTYSLKSAKKEKVRLPIEVLLTFSCSNKMLKPIFAWQTPNCIGTLSKGNFYCQHYLLFPIL